MPNLTWLTRDEDLKRAASVAYKLLEPVHDLSCGETYAGNMLIQGDNLSALKALLPYYKGQVRCIYADPPFNTKQAFPDYDDNLEHTIWLSTLYPLLELQRELLASDGTLFIHIDDNELAYLIAIADEIFGRKNRVAVVTFKQGAATGHKAINPGMVNTTNFLVVYAKEKSHWRPKRLFTGRERDKRYGQFISNRDDHFSKWRLITLAAAFSNHKGRKTSDLKKELGQGYEEELNAFVIANADRVIRTARPDYDAVGEAVQQIINKSQAEPSEYLLLERPNLPAMYFKAGERLLFYRDKLKEVDGELVAGEPLTTLWDDLLSNNLHNEGGVDFPKSKKPEALLKRILELSTQEDDIVLDAFLGSGTTAAVAHKMCRRFIGIERGEHAVTKCQPRLKTVVAGDQSGISKQVGWNGGGGFTFYRLGEEVFDVDGRVQPGIKFSSLAAHVWFSETGVPFTGASDSPFLGTHGPRGYALLYNGILGDKSVSGGNVLTGSLLTSLRTMSGHDGPLTIYGEASRVGDARLKAAGVTFKQTPYDVKAR